MPALCGVYVAAITPRREGPEADLSATFELLDYLSASGVNGVALMGSTGEFVHFPIEERIRVASLGIKRCRIPVLVGIGHSTFDGAIELGRAAADAGAGALLLMPPHFFRYTQEEIREFYLRAADELAGTAPLLLYNIPAFASEIECATAVELLSTGLFAGLKDSSGRWENFVALRSLRAKQRFTLLAGNDLVYAPTRLAGADGVVSGCACAVPELLLALDRAILAGKAEPAAALDERLHEFISWIDQFPAPVGIREAVAARGLRTGPHAAPLSTAGRKRAAEFRDWFHRWLPVVKKECSSV